MRYTESRLDKISKHMLEDIDKDTVDFQPNFDDSEQEPTVYLLDFLTYKLTEAMVLL